jgi:hypothetical protein
MLKEAIQYIVGLKDAKLFDVNGEQYSTEQLHRIPKVYDPTPKADSVDISTLTGLVDYIKNGVDNLEKTLIVHIVSPTTVKVYSELRSDKQREHFIDCSALTPKITYGQFMDVESFNIMIQSCFLPNEHSAAVLKVVGNIVEENVQNTSDDGISQKVTAKAGIAKVAEIDVPNPVILCPFRTFPEVGQPESKFVFRMRGGDGNGVKAAIFEADGGIWRIYAMQNVKEYLSEKLTDCNVKIIS